MTANFPTGHRDYPRSPSRHDFYNDSRERGSGYRHDMRGGRESDRHYGDGDYAYSRRDGSSRGARSYPQGDHDYSGMYDDDHRYGHYDDTRSGDGTSYRSEGGTGGFRTRSPAGGYRSRSRSQSPARDAGRPSDTIILEGLPYSLSTNELRESLLSNSIAAEFPSIDVRIPPSKGHRRAFVQFQEMNHAAAFVKEHFPQLLLHLPHSTDEVPEGRFEAYIHYARSRDEGEQRGPIGANWTCPSCDFSNYASRSKCKICGESPSASTWQQSLTGDLDASDVPSQILVVYPLAPFVNEDMFAGDMKRLEKEQLETCKDTSSNAPKLKSTAPTAGAPRQGARPGSLHRVFLMRDVNTNESYKYGFAEFWTLEDATAAMAKVKLLRSFTVAACLVTVSTIHMGVFVPEEREVTAATESFSFKPLFNPALRVKYRDPHAYPSCMVVACDPPPGDSVPTTVKPQDAGEPGDGKKSKKRKADGNPGASAVKKSVPMAGHMALWQRKHDEIHSGNSGPKNRPSDVLSDANRVPLNVGSSSLTKSDAKAPIKISLSGSTMLSASSAPSGSGLSSGQATSPEREDGVQSENNGSGAQSSSGGDVVSYVDRERLMCLICMRKYKSVDEVNIHEKSRNHKTAMENEDSVKAALPRLAARDKRLQKQAQENEDGDALAASQYRDRAKERRQAFNQPNKPSAQGDKAKSDAPGKIPPSKKEESSISGSSKDNPSQPPPVAQSKGAGMLAKMGWMSGSGLGANGDGRTEVIATNAYQEGAGLGAEGANLGDAAELAEKKTRNTYADYVSTVQDKARERYNRLG